MERSPHRNHHDLGPSVREPADVVVGRVCRDVGQTMVEPLPPTQRLIDD